MIDPNEVQINMTKTTFFRHPLWFSCVIVVLLSHLACSTQAPAALASNKQDANQLFIGEWTYARKCDFGHFVNIMLKQAANDVSGEWSEGTNLRGSNGLLKGTIRDGKLFARYCSQDGEKGYTACPEYGDETNYFIREGDGLIRYQKFGNEYKKEIALYRDVAGEQLLIDGANCQEETDEESAP